jgi:hypothetical protein
MRPRLLALAALVAAAPAAAQTIETRSGSPGLWRFGQPGAPCASCFVSVGETFTTPAYATTLTGFNFTGVQLLSPTNPNYRGPVEYQTFVAPWTGTAPSAALWTSAVMNGPAFNPVSIDLVPLSFSGGGITLAPNTQYVAWMSITGNNVAGESFWVDAYSTDTYTGGDFVYRTSTSDSWFKNPGAGASRELGFTATLAAVPAVVPEPSTVVLMGTGLLAVGGVIARRKQVTR